MKSIYIIKTTERTKAETIRAAAEKAGLMCIPSYLGDFGYTIELAATTPDQVYILDLCILYNSGDRRARSALKDYITGDFETIQALMDHEREKKHIETWYDRHTRDYVIQIKTAAGDQVGEAVRVGNKKERDYIKHLMQLEIKNN